jgi:hypothetical protein
MREKRIGDTASEAHNYAEKDRSAVKLLAEKLIREEDKSTHI